MENNMSVSIKINNREIGPDFPPLVLAEVGINHDGNFDKAILGNFSSIRTDGNSEGSSFKINCLAKNNTKIKKTINGVYE